MKYLKCVNEAEMGDLIMIETRSKSTEPYVNVPVIFLSCKPGKREGSYVVNILAKENVFWGGVIFSDKIKLLSELKSAI